MLCKCLVMLLYISGMQQTANMKSVKLAQITLLERLNGINYQLLISSSI